MRDLQRTNYLVVMMLEAYDASLRRDVERSGRVFASLYGRELQGGGHAAAVQRLVADFAARSRVVASVFVRDGDGFAVSASSLGDVQGIADADSLLSASASQEVMRGREFIDKVTVSGKEYMAHFAPLRDASGRVTGALSVGLDLTDALKALKQNIVRVKIGDTGYVYAIDAREKEGELTIHPAVEGTNLLEARDGSGRQFVREMLEIAAASSPTTGPTPANRKPGARSSFMSAFRRGTG